MGDEIPKFVWKRKRKRNECLRCPDWAKKLG